MGGSKTRLRSSQAGNKYKIEYENLLEDKVLLLIVKKEWKQKVLIGL